LCTARKGQRPENRYHQPMAGFRGGHANARLWVPRWGRGHPGRGSVEGPSVGICDRQLSLPVRWSPAGAKQGGAALMRLAGFDAAELAGGLLVAIGGIAVMVGAGAYPIGSLQRMAAGYLPLVTGALLAGFGLALIVASRSAATELPNLKL